MVNVNQELTVLVTGAGAPGLPGTLYLLRNNSERRPVRVIGIDTNPDVGGRFLVDRFFVVPAPEEPHYLDVLCRICDSEAVDVVLPQTTREIMRLSSSKGLLERRGVLVMVSDAHAVEIANNKWLLAKRTAELGVPTPAAYLAKSEPDLHRFVEALGYPERPVVIKPPVSNGMRGVRILRREPWGVQRFLSEKPSGIEITLDELLRILRQGPGWPELLVMEYLPGPEYSVDVYLGIAAAIAVPRLRQSVRSGITFVSKTELRSDLSDYSLLLAREIGLRYAIGFQFKVDTNGVPKILECNPRIQGTMVASVFSGVNMIWLGVKELFGEPVVATVKEASVSQFYRVWGGVGVAGDFVDEI